MKSIVLFTSARKEAVMEDDRKKTVFHLTVRLSVVSGKMRSTSRSFKERVMKAVRRGIIRLVLFSVKHLTGND